MARRGGARLRRSKVVAAVLAAGAVASAAAAAKRSLEAYASVAGIRLGPTAFDDARRQLGTAPLVHDGGDAAASRRHVCFTSEDGTTLALACWEGCGDGTRGADEYQLARDVERIEFGGHGYRPPAEFDPRCTPTRAISGATAAGSIRLGMTTREVVAALGEPDRRASGRLEYADGRFHLTVSTAGGVVVAVMGALWWE